MKVPKVIDRLAPRAASRRQSRQGAAKVAVGIGVRQCRDYLPKRSLTTDVLLARAVKRRHGGCSALGGHAMQEHDESSAAELFDEARGVSQHEIQVLVHVLPNIVDQPHVDLFDARREVSFSDSA